MLNLFQKQLTSSVKTWRSSSVIFWLALSLTYGLVYAYVGGLSLAFEDNYIIQDDGRQHVYWMMQYIDPELFPNDLITDYFQSVAPWGYANLYKGVAGLGVNPILFSKILPLLLGLVATGYCFGLTLTIFPIPVTGFIATSLLNQEMWMNDNLSSATARAFVIPLFLVFLYYLVRRAVVPCLGAIALLGLFYPTYALMAAGMIVLQLVNWRNGGLKLMRDQRDYWLCGIGLAVIFVMLLPFAFSLSDFDPVISVEQAKQLPEFYPGGRSTFFWNNPLIYWFWGRSGMFSINLFLAPLLLLGIFLPILMRFPTKFSLLGKLKPEAVILAKMLVVGFSFFFASHLLLFKLHLPSRYTQYGMPIILAISAGIVITIVFNSLWNNFQKKQAFGLSKLIPLIIIPSLSLIILLYPGVVQAIPQAYYVEGQYEGLYHFFAQQPKDIMIASIAEEADNIPSFAQRSVFASREVAIPYHWGYYGKLRERIMETITAQYSLDMEELKAFNEENEIDFWLLKAEVFAPSYLQPEASDSPLAFLNSNHKTWLQQYQPLVTEIRKELEAGKTPALAQVTDRCTVFQDQEYFVVDADCI